MLDAPPLTIRTEDPGESKRWGATVRYPSQMLSLALATVLASMPGGSCTIIASANGTATMSVHAPPHSPPTTPNPYIEPCLTDVQLPVSPLMHRGHSPHAI